VLGQIISRASGYNHAWEGMGHSWGHARGGKLELDRTERHVMQSGSLATTVHDDVSALLATQLKVQLEEEEGN
jgi:hypothetical protein